MFLPMVLLFILGVVCLFLCSKNYKNMKRNISTAVFGIAGVLLFAFAICLALPH